MGHHGKHHQNIHRSRCIRKINQVTGMKDIIALSTTTPAQFPGLLMTFATGQANNAEINYHLHVETTSDDVLTTEVRVNNQVVLTTINNIYAFGTSTVGTLSLVGETPIKTISVYWFSKNGNVRSVAKSVALLSCNFWKSGTSIICKKKFKRTSGTQNSIQARTKATQYPGLSLYWGNGEAKNAEIQYHLHVQTNKQDILYIQLLVNDTIVATSVNTIFPSNQTTVGQFNVISNGANDIRSIEVLWYSQNGNIRSVSGPIPILATFYWK